LIITGMHRSGTSLLTQWLHKCGLHVGDQFLGAGIGNDDGHYEDIDFYNFHQQTLSAQGLHPDGLITEQPSSLSSTQREALRCLLQHKSDRQSQWGWKDPRSCLFLPVYRELAPDARYLVILRDYKQVVGSLIHRIYVSHEWKYTHTDIFTKLIWLYCKKPFRKKKLTNQYCDAYLKVWIAYNEAILKHLQAQPKDTYLVVDHPDLRRHSKLVFDHLSTQWQFDLEYFDINKIYKQQLISNKLDIVDYIKDPALLQQAADIQCRLQALAV